MKWLFLLPLLLLGCGANEQEQTLQDIAMKQERLEKEIETTKEENRQLKEAKIKAEQKAAEEAAERSRRYSRAEIVGTWRVRMKCTEANCAGNTAGQTFQEEWAVDEIGNGQMRVVVLSSSRMKNQVTDTEYQGTFNGKVLTLSYAKEGGWGGESVRVGIGAQITNGGKGFVGIRQVNKDVPCTIRYDIVGTKDSW